MSFSTEMATSPVLGVKTGGHVDIGRKPRRSFGRILCCSLTHVSSGSFDPIILRNLLCTPALPVRGTFPEFRYGTIPIPQSNEEVRYVKKTNSHSRAARAIAVGIGLAMAGGMSIVATTPAFAAVDPWGYTVPEVYASDIAPNESVYTGWHQGYANSADAHKVSAEGLVLTGKSQVIYGYDKSARWSVEYQLFKNYVADGQVSWTTTAASDPAFFQIPIYFGVDTATPSFTTLRPAAPTTGKNVAALDQQWVTSGVIGAEYGKNATDTLGNLLDAVIAEQNAEILGFGVLSQDGEQSVVTGISWLGVDYTFHPGTRMSPGTVAISGKAQVGSVLTATVAGWPSGATFSYQWYSATENMGGPIEGATGPTYTVTAEDLGKFIGVDIVGHADGFGDAYARADVTAVVTAPMKPAAPAPVANSTGLAGYLAANGAAVQPQGSAGLPAGNLDPTKPHTATLTWAEADSWVDVYMYSTPVFVGSFPVVNGQAQITLSAKLLSQLAAGSHTLVVTGQTSGAVQAVGVSVAAVLPATGAEPAVPLSVAALLLLLGSTLIVLRRKGQRS
jgi:LPXTG-motif cell wall-anchored protein